MATSGIYTADALPTAASPAWTKTQSVAPTTEAVSGGELHLKTASTQTCFYTLTDAGVGFGYGVIEARMKWVSGTDATAGAQTPFYAQLIIGGKCAGSMGPNGSGTIRYWYNNGTTGVSTDVTVGDTTGYHTYRVEFSDGALFFFFDGALVGSYAGPHLTTTTSTVFRIGDGTSSSTGITEGYYDNVIFECTSTADQPAGAEYLYEFPITVSATNGQVISATIPDWADMYGNLRTLASGKGVRVFKADRTTEVSRDFAAGVVKWTAADSATTYYVKLGRSDAGPPPLAGLGAAAVTATVGTRRRTYTSISITDDVAATTGGTTSVGCYGMATATGLEAAQKIVPTVTGNLARVGLWLKNQTDSRPADTDYSQWITVRVESDNGGAPSGVVLGRMRLPFAVIPKNATGFREVVFRGRGTIKLTASSTYWLVLEVPKNTSTNAVLWEQDASTPSYAQGVRTRAANGVWGSTDTTKNFLFRTSIGFEGTPTLPDVSVTTSRTPYILPSALPSWAQQAPPHFGLNGRIEDGGDAYFSTFAVDDTTGSNSGMSSFMVRNSDKAVSTSTKLLDGFVDGTSTNDKQKRVTALWKSGATYKGVSTYKTADSTSVDATARRLHYVTASALMNTAFTDNGELTVDATSPYEHKFATRNDIAGQTYLYFDISPTYTLYAADGVRNAVQVRALYDDAQALTNVEYIEWDLDGVQGDVAQAWIYTSIGGEYVGFIHAQYQSGSFYSGTIYYAKSLDGVVWSPAKQLFTLGPQSTLSAGASIGATAVSFASVTGIVADDYIVIQGNSGTERAQEELRKVLSVVGTTVNLTAALTYAHSSGVKVGRVDSGSALAYSADFTNPTNVKLWGYTSPANPWNGSDVTFWGVYPMEFTGNLSALITPAFTAYASPSRRATRGLVLR